MTKTLVITGASRGLGRHLCEKARDKGYRVIGLARSVAPLDGIEMRACDVGDPAQVKASLASLKRDGTVQGLICAAGVASMNLLLTTPIETVDRIIRTNLLGTIYCCREMAGPLAKRKNGRIILFSTIAVPLAIKGEAVYAASKGGVEAFARSFAREMADHGVTVNTIAPGPIDTALIAKVPAANIQTIVDDQLIPRRGTSDDVWNIVSLVLAEESAMLTGQVFHVGGA